MTSIYAPRHAVATKQGTVLTALVSHAMNPDTKQTSRTYPSTSWSAQLREWFTQATEGDQVDITVSLTNDNKATVDFRYPPVLQAIPPDPDRQKALHQHKGFVNPYTFVPTLPRTTLLDNPEAPGLGDSGPGGPPSHARIDAGQWSGVLRVRLTCLTPLLLPDTQHAGKEKLNAQGENTNARNNRSTPEPAERTVFDTRLGPDDRPHILPTSLKGALRSAFETITASRFGVFTGHDLPLDYRLTTRNAGRKSFPSAPEQLLDASLQPARTLQELSPADRVFGWVPPNGAQAARTATSSGYRGRLRVTNIRCLDKLWRWESPTGQGVVLAPLSSPKPTQFRFYAAKNSDGQPIARAAAKESGYHATGGLRGRKMYRWSKEDPEYWQPPEEFDNGQKLPNGRQREYLDLGNGEGASASQTVRYKSWVKFGTIFTAELHLDGIPEPELGALIWLLNQGNANAPLRLGAGKPLGFGVMKTELLWDDDAEPATKLWDSTAKAASWRSLTRPDPAERQRIEALANRFDDTARRHPVLAEAIESYLQASKAVDHSIHYPRPTAVRTPESYKWFVENEKPDSDGLTRGWALPHVRDPEPQLPFLPNKPDHRGSTTPRPPQPSKPSTPKDRPREGRPAPGSDKNRPRPHDRKGRR